MIEAWSGYEFPGRGSAYSPLKWNKEHFTGIDYDHKTQSKGVWKFEGKEWAQDVDEELGSYDYLYERKTALLAASSLTSSRVACSPMWITTTQRSGETCSTG